MLFFSAKPNSYLDDPDVKSMMAFIQGHPQSFEEIMHRNYQRIFAFIARMIGDDIQSEDLTQEVFLKLYGMKGSYKPSSKLSTLLFQMARNIALNHLRDNKKFTSTDKPIEDIQLVSPDLSLENEELAQQVRQAIDSLPENQRTAVLLRRFEEMSYEDIALTMKTTPKAIKSLLNRAKENLKASLQENF